ncbi:MAG: N-6 DNA methylase [Minisyncoccia bacterium]
MFGIDRDQKLGLDESKKRRILGEHLTPIEIFENFIFPEIKSILNNYVWVDLFAGKGNLILPILKYIPYEKRIEFFKNHIYLFDIQDDLVQSAIENAMQYGIPRTIAENNIMKRDTIENYPDFLLKLNWPIYHITNPPYLYIGYIKKHKETQSYLKYFQNSYSGYQDLYQLALINDLKFGVQNMIYIIPSNFLFGSSVSNKIRDDFLKYYYIKKALIFEKEIFEFTGTNVVICFFERKLKPSTEYLSFQGIKINSEMKEKKYFLSPENHYRAGNEFNDFVTRYKSGLPLSVSYYLTKEEVEANYGEHELDVIDANDFDGKQYSHKKIYVNGELYDKIKSNILFVKTVDSGSWEGRVGLYVIKDVFNADGILVSKSKYRTHPIQIFLEPKIDYNTQIILMKYFNIVLEYFRELTDSEFMTTYKYSKSEYTRKYLGLTQAEKLIKTFPWLELNNKEKLVFKELIIQNRKLDIIKFIKDRNSMKVLEDWD